MSSFCEIEDCSFTNQIFLEDLVTLLEVLIENFNFLKGKNFISIYHLFYLNECVSNLENISDRICDTEVLKLVNIMLDELKPLKENDLKIKIASYLDPFQRKEIISDKKERIIEQLQYEEDKISLTDCLDSSNHSTSELEEKLFVKRQKNSSIDDYELIVTKQLFEENDICNFYKNRNSKISILFKKYMLESIYLKPIDIPIIDLSPDELYIYLNSTLKL